MAFFIQHGHGKGSRITDALDNGTADGVIFSARNEQPGNLLSCVSSISEDHPTELMIDPQFFVGALSPPNEGHLPEYGYYAPGLTAASFTLRNIRGYVKRTLQFQTRAPVTRLISPTVLFSSFNDRWFQIALNMADASLEQHAEMNDPPPLLLSFHFSENALLNFDEVSRFLDTVTQDAWTMKGIYLAVMRDGDQYDACFSPDAMSNLMYICTALGMVNDLEVVIGHADYCGIMLRAAGASAFASGWHQGQRRFLRSKYIEQASRGGKPPRLRYASNPLLTSIFLNELEAIKEVGYFDEVLSEVDSDESLREADDDLASAWSLSASQRQHFQALHKLDQDWPTGRRARLRKLKLMIDRATGLYLTLESSGVHFDKLTNSQHLTDWREALGNYASRANIDLG